LGDRLLSEGFRVIALDNLITGSTDNIAHLAGNQDFMLIRHNVSEFIFIPGRVDYVFHFASPASPIDYLELYDLIREGALVTAYDPKGNQKIRELNLCPGVHLANSALEAVQDAEALVLATEWPEFSEVDLTEVHQVMRMPMVFDGRNLFDPATMRDLGFQYFGIGRPLAESGHSNRNSNGASTPPIVEKYRPRLFWNGLGNGVIHST